MRIIITIVISLICLNSQAQLPVTFKTYNGNIASPYRVELASDSGILVCGSNWYFWYGELFKLDANGKKLWSRVVSSTETTVVIGFKQAMNGGYYVFGYTHLFDTLGDGFVCKLNSCGNPIWGQIFKISQLNYVNDIQEINDSQLLIQQTGNSFRSVDGNLNTLIGVFSKSKNNYNKLFLFPTGPMNKKSSSNNNLYYNFSYWFYPNKSNPNLMERGSSFSTFNNSLTDIKVQHLKHFDTIFPTIYTPPIFLENGTIISGGNFQGYLPYLNPSAPSFVKLSKDLKINYWKETGHTRPITSSEQVEFVNLISQDKFIASINYAPDGLKKPSFAEFYIVDTNFIELKKIIYGNPSKSYKIFDVIPNFDSKLLVLMDEYSSPSNIKYHIVKLDKNLNLDSNKIPPKKYDWLCPNLVDTFGYIDVSNFDTMSIVNWKNQVFFTNVEYIKDDELINIYPNPNNGSFTIKVKGITEVEINSIDGKTLFKRFYKNCNIAVIEKEFYFRGIAIVKIKTNDDFFTKKIIINQ